MISGERGGKTATVSTAIMIIVCPLSLSNESGFTQRTVNSLHFSHLIFTTNTQLALLLTDLTKEDPMSKSLNLIVPIFPLQKRRRRIVVREKFTSGL